jgi:tetratricopeptide (TPR) repeat protein
MWRMRLCGIIFLFFVLFISCSSGIKLQFQQPAQKVLIGIRSLVIAPCEDSDDAALICNYLNSLLKQQDYFSLYDSNQFSSALEQMQLSYEKIKQLDTLSQVAILPGVDAIIFSVLKSIEILSDELGVDQVQKSVWTGEYERDQNGQIIEEISSTGEKLRKKKIKLETVDQHFRVRSAKLNVAFQLIDLKKNKLILSQQLVENYTSGKIIKEESQPIPTNDEIKRILAQNVVAKFLGQISPKNIMVKRPIEQGTALLDSGAVHANANRWRQAQEIWSEAEKALPTDARIYYNLGLAAEAQGDFDSAHTYYQKAVLLNPKKKLYQKAAENIRKVWQEK